MDEFLWVETYRPNTIDDCILPRELKDTFNSFIQQRNIPNLILNGLPGVGKTTVARAMLQQLNCDYIVINGSMSGNIDTLRNEIKNFASTVSFSPGRKYVILDEADYLNAQSTQPALRNFMEEFSKNCGFILTCNYLNKIIEPLQSRCAVITFNIPAQEKELLIEESIKRVRDILKTENVQCQIEDVAAFVIKHFPDLRRVLNELQRYSASGKISSSVLKSAINVSYDQLLGYLRKKDFKSIRKWVAANQPDSTMLYRYLYDNASKYLAANQIAQLIIILGEYQYKQAFVADSEINIVACLTEIMLSCEFR